MKRIIALIVDWVWWYRRLWRCESRLRHARTAWRLARLTADPRRAESLRF